MFEQQFTQMDPFGASGFPSMRGFEDRMQQQMQEMDKQFDRAFADMDRAQQQLDAELERGLRQLQEQQPGVRIERREEKSPGSYRCVVDATLCQVTCQVRSRHSVWGRPGEGGSAGMSVVCVGGGGGTAAAGFGH